MDGMTERESRWEKDAMTVEIGFALFTGALLGGALCALIAGPTWIWHLPPGAEDLLRMAGSVLGCGAGVWRAVTVLVRFDRARRLGR
ncbi:DUF6332 family protein [Streptomyces sp. SGAir0957]